MAGGEGEADLDLCEGVFELVFTARDEDDVGALCCELCSC